MCKILMLIENILLINLFLFAQPSVPQVFTASGYEKHIELTWNSNTESNLAGYNIYKKNDTGFVKVASISKNNIPVYIDFIDSVGTQAAYKISSYDVNGGESALSDSVSSSTHFMNNDEFLDMVQKATFRFFWDYGHPVSGLARDRLGGGETVTIGGSGFGVMAILVGIERGYISREQGVQRILKILNFLSTKADRFHGVFSHWLNGTSGEVIPFSQYDDGGDLVETAFLIQGLLTARQYFNKNNSDEINIRNLITDIWESVDWDWYKQYTYSFTLYWHWSPNYGWKMNMPIRGYNEALIVYLLGIASPSHPITKGYYFYGWSGFSYKNNRAYYGIPLYVGHDYGGPLFFAHYSYLGFDPRDKKDKFANYFHQNRNQTLVNRAFCIDNPNGFAGYSDSTWGLTASDDPFGYSAHSPSNDNGTISPTAAISSMPYTPEESIQALKGLYRKFGKLIWGAYGFKDAFNPTENWYAQSYLAIDQGPIIIMIENYRSQLLWENFMANPEIPPMLDSIGFQPDLTSIKNPKTGSIKGFRLYQNYPNPFNPSTKIKYTIPAIETKHASSLQMATLKVYDILGNELVVLVKKEQSPGNYEVEFNTGKMHLSSGIYFYELSAGAFTSTKKMILLK